MFDTKSILAKQPKRGFPAYVVFLCAVTAIYLAIEVPFAAYLVGVMGGNPDPDTIHRVEHTGRIVSGFALALAYWSFQIPRALKNGKGIWRIVVGCAFSAALLMPAVYFGEKLLVDHIAETASARDRQQAARVIAAREALFHPQAMEGITDTSSHTDGSWNAFRSLFGFLSFFDRDVLARIPAGSNAVDTAIGRSIPSESEFRTDVLPDLIRAYGDRFEPYKALSDAHDEALGKMYTRIEDAWSDHIAYYRRVGASRSRAEVISRGVEVPSNWNPTDKDTFVRVIAMDHRRSIDNRYQDGIDRMFGEGAAVSPAKNTYAVFMSSNQIQALMAKDLALSGKAPFEIGPGMPITDEVRLYRLHRDGFMNDLKAAYQGDHWLFSAKERFGQVGEESVRSVIAPVLALFLSILGAFGHMFKLVNYALVLVLYMRQSQIGITRLLREHGIIRIPLLGAAAAYAAMTAYAPAVEITSTGLYQRSVGAWSDRTGDGVAKSIEWTISVQPWISPVSDALRVVGLFAPVEAYLAEGTVPDLLPPPTDTAEALSEAVYGTVSVDGVDAMIQMPRPRPNR